MIAYGRMDRSDEDAEKIHAESWHRLTSCCQACSRKGDSAETSLLYFASPATESSGIPLKSEDESHKAVISHHLPRRSGDPISNSDNLSSTAAHTQLLIFRPRIRSHKKLFMQGSSDMAVSSIGRQSSAYSYQTFASSCSLRVVHPRPWLFCHEEMHGARP